MVNIKAEFQQNPQSENALKVVQRLHKAGYEAFLVGGCVRDLLLGKSPKDFDVATDAHPDRIKSLFNSARIVGRRFQIVHVRFGRDIIEVTTFRAPAQDEGSVTEGGMLLSDNVYGNYEQDVMRRDFTMNALYYDAENDEVRDLVNGRNDIDDRVIRLIGDPEVRFREDPVRMLRAARFEAKLGFEIDPTAAEAIHRLGHMLQEIPPARLFEEALKLFMSGHGEASFESLCRHNLTGWLFPNYAKPAEEADIRSEGQAHTLIKLALASTDNRIREGLPVTPAFVLAALLWWPYLAEQRRLKEVGATKLAASHESALNVITQQQFSVSIPKRFGTPMRDIWHLQARLHNTKGKKPAAVARHKRFRAAYDFLLLREASGENLNNLGEWWTQYQEENPVVQNSPPPRRKRRPKSRNRRPRPSA